MKHSVLFSVLIGISFCIGKNCYAENVQWNYVASLIGTNYDYIMLPDVNNLIGQIKESNSYYEIREDYDLGNQTLRIPENCILDFKGGSISNGTIVFNNTTLIGNVRVKSEIKGSLANEEIKSNWFPNSSLHDIMKLGSIYTHYVITGNYTLSRPLDLFNYRYVELLCDITNTPDAPVVLGTIATQVIYSYCKILNCNYIRVEGGKNLDFHIDKCNQLTLYTNGSIASRGSIAYSRFHLGTVNRVIIDSENKGWINENSFYDGRIANVIIKGDYSHNQNIFYHPKMENSSISIEKGFSNCFYDIRFEGSNKVYFGKGTRGNIIKKTYLYTTNFASWVFGDNANVINEGESSNRVYLSSEGLKITDYNINKTTLSSISEAVSTKEDNLEIKSNTDIAELTWLPDGDLGIAIDVQGRNNTSESLRYFLYLYDKDGKLIDVAETSAIQSTGSLLKFNASNNTYSSGVNKDACCLYFMPSRLSSTNVAKVRLRIKANANMSCRNIRIRTVYNPMEDPVLLLTNKL